jgi:DNA-binding SARP family transcriptional activator
MPTLHIHLLGEFRIVYDETQVTTIDWPRLQSLLAYLILHRDAAQSRRHPAILFWPDSTEEQAHTNLRHLVYRSRHALPNASAYLRCLKGNANTRKPSGLHNCCCAKIHYKRSPIVS